MQTAVPQQWIWGQTDLDLTLEAVYRIASDEGGVNRFIDHLTARWPGTRAGISYHDISDRKAGRLLNIVGNWKNLDAYAKYYFKINPWQPMLPHLGTDHAKRTDQTMIATADLRKTKFYGDYLSSNQVDAGISVHFQKGVDTQSSIGLGYDERMLSSDTELNALVDLMNAISPHVRRAFRLRARGAGTELGSSALMRYLDTTLDAVFIVGADGKIIAQNAAAEDMLIASQIVGIDRFEGLRLADIDANRTLYSRLRSAALVGSLNHCFDESAIPVLGDGGPCLIEVIPAKPISSVDLFTDAPGATAIVSIRSATVGLRLDSTDMRKIFQFTMSETRLAQALLEGRDVAGHAEDRAISIHTARTHLRSLLGKAGVTRQHDLVRMLTRFAKRRVER